jgi:predicted GNAT superfamily acetyltransferase
VGTATISIEKITEIWDFYRCEELQRQVWGMGDTSVVPVHLLLTAQKNGGLVLGAFDEQGAMVDRSSTALTWLVSCPSIRGNKSATVSNSPSESMS